jgi:hypothetical protein
MPEVTTKYEIMAMLHIFIADGRSKPSSCTRVWVVSNGLAGRGVRRGTFVSKEDIGLPDYVATELCFDPLPAERRAMTTSSHMVWIAANRTLPEPKP